jgi:hypothetical protein
MNRIIAGAGTVKVLSIQTGILSGTVPVWPIGSLYRYSGNVPLSYYMSPAYATLRASPIVLAAYSDKFSAVAADHL